MCIHPLRASFLWPAIAVPAKGLLNWTFITFRVCAHGEGSLDGNFPTRLPVGRVKNDSVFCHELAPFQWGKSAPWWPYCFLAQNPHQELTGKFFCKLHGCSLQRVIGTELDAVSMRKPCLIRANNPSCVYILRMPFHGAVKVLKKPCPSPSRRTPMTLLVTSLIHRQS